MKLTLALIRKAHVSPAMVTAAVEDVLPISTSWGNKCVIVLNVNHVPEPEDMDTRMYNGLHPSMMKTFCHGPHFDNVIKQAVDNMKDATSKGITSFVFICIDKLGRYAALTLGKSLTEIALADKFLTLEKITTLNQNTDLECGPCGRCIFWDRRFGEKNWAVAIMIDKWNDHVRGPLVTQ
jgi:hypothetical protein